MTDTGTTSTLRRRRGRRVLVAAATAIGLLLLPFAARSASADPVNAGPSGSQHGAGHTITGPMHDLDFLLGSYKCAFTASTVGDSTVYIQTSPTLGGTFYELDITQVKTNPASVLHGRWVIGWSAAENQYVSSYYDDQVSHGTSTAPARQGANLTFTGAYALGAKGTFGVRDDFVVDSRRHFLINEFLQINGQWLPFDVQDCSRR